MKDSIRMKEYNNRNVPIKHDVWVYRGEGPNGSVVFESKTKVDCLNPKVFNREPYFRRKKGMPVHETIPPGQLLIKKNFGKGIGKKLILMPCKRIGYDVFKQELVVR